MSKTKLFVDFDNTISNSSKSICSCYNSLYKDEKDFKQAKYWELQEYNFTDICPLMPNVTRLFSDKMFFERLEFINGNTQDILDELNDAYEVHITTIGTLRNLSLKALWIEKNLPFIKYAELINIDKCAMNKSIINMQDGIFIDDVLSNIISSDATYKYIFGDEYNWNIGSEYPRLINWTDVKNILLKQNII